MDMHALPDFGISSEEVNPRSGRRLRLVVAGFPALTHTQVGRHAGERGHALCRNRQRPPYRLRRSGLAERPMDPALNAGPKPFRTRTP